MSIWEISVIVLGGSLLLLVLFAIPAILQVRRTVKSVDLALESVNEKLPEILGNLQLTAAHIRETLEVVRIVPSRFRDVAAGFREVGGQVGRLERKWRDGLQAGAGAGMPALLKTATLALGAFRLLRFFLPRGR